MVQFGMSRNRISPYMGRSLCHTSNCPGWSVLIVRPETLHRGCLKQGTDLANDVGSDAVLFPGLPRLDAGPLANRHEAGGAARVNDRLSGDEPRLASCSGAELTKQPRDVPLSTGHYLTLYRQYHRHLRSHAEVPRHTRKAAAALSNSSGLT